MIATLQAQIAIDQDYPKIPPLFAINVTWNYERNFSNDEAIRVLIKIYTVGFSFYILSE
jgi:hypothetical protein